MWFNLGCGGVNFRLQMPRHCIIPLCSPQVVQFTACFCAVKKKNNCSKRKVVTFDWGKGARVAHWNFMPRFSGSFFFFLLPPMMKWPWRSYSLHVMVSSYCLLRWQWSCLVSDNHWHRSQSIFGPRLLHRSSLPLQSNHVFWATVAAVSCNHMSFLLHIVLCT